MDDTAFGQRDKRGHWRPFQRVEYPKVFVWPPRPLAILKWLPAYLWPWNFLYAGLALLFWLVLTPPLATMKTLAPGWIAYLLACNLVMALLFFGAFHAWLYVRKAQGQAFKYNPRWPATDKPDFLFRNQTLDNMTWSLASGVPMWTAYESLTLWAYANGYLPYVDWRTQPLYCGALMLVIPLLRECHFFFVHRLLHWPPLYRIAHKLHHFNVNPGPWSGLSMHPIEHLLYFSGVLLHWVVPSHPIHALFHLFHAGLSPAPGHTGFDRIVIGAHTSFDSHCFAHYLHHKYFECNYADGSVPLDQWFGTFHDGSDAAQQTLDKRLRARAAKA
ncbi:MAG: sterol desaturase family protein [Gammaproteobacteria bacterium]